MLSLPNLGLCSLFFKSMHTEIITTLSDLAPEAWNRLTQNNPFLRHEFLHALHESGCACEKTGWSPHFIVGYDEEQLVAALPLYLKYHSRGEYVFDWSWADAYERHGLRYYPKLLSAVPFTPVTGARLLLADASFAQPLIEQTLDFARESKASSWHCLFAPSDQATALSQASLLIRHGVQFHWVNEGARTFDEYLSRMNHNKRKKIKQERRRVQQDGFTFQWREGHQISASDWAFFYSCYANTYRLHGNSPYLNEEFFLRIGASMPENILMIVSYHKDQPVAASLNLHNEDHLYGRYWGSTQYFPMLHFETCYYQVIEYCLARGIPVFEGGAQGEHKLARGLLPVKTYSAHWLAHPQFSAAVDHFLQQEKNGIAHYIDELTEHSPFVDSGLRPASES